MIVPCREGLLIPADSGVAFQHVVRHLGIRGLPYEHARVDQERQYAPGHLGRCQRLARGPQQADEREAAPPGARAPSSRSSRRRASVRLTPLGTGDWNTLAAGYRRIAQQKGLAVTLHQKIGRDPHAERLLAQPT